MARTAAQIIGGGVAAVKFRIVRDAAVIDAALLLQRGYGRRVVHRRSSGNANIAASAGCHHLPRSREGKWRSA